VPTDAKRRPLPPVEAAHREAIARLARDLSEQLETMACRLEGACDDAWAAEIIGVITQIAPKLNGDITRSGRLLLMDWIDSFATWACSRGSEPSTNGRSRGPAPTISIRAAGVILREFAREYPLSAAKLEPGDVAPAIEAWTARGAPRRTRSERPLKWPTLADLIRKAGLGELKPASVEQEWQKRLDHQDHRLTWGPVELDWDTALATSADNASGATPNKG
jgi:hypothetical protein